MIKKPKDSWASSREKPYLVVLISAFDICFLLILLHEKQAIFWLVSVAQHAAMGLDTSYDSIISSFKDTMEHISNSSINIINSFLEHSVNINVYSSKKQFFLFDITIKIILVKLFKFLSIFNVYILIQLK